MNKILFIKNLLKYSGLLIVSDPEAKYPHIPFKIIDQNRNNAETNINEEQDDFWLFLENLHNNKNNLKSSQSLVSYIKRNFQVDIGYGPIFYSNTRELSQLLESDDEKEMVEKLSILVKFTNHQLYSLIEKVLIANNNIKALTCLYTSDDIYKNNQLRHLSFQKGLQSLLSGLTTLKQNIPEPEFVTYFNRIQRGKVFATEKMMNKLVVQSWIRKNISTKYWNDLSLEEPELNKILEPEKFSYDLQMICVNKSQLIKQFLSTEYGMSQPLKARDLSAEVNKICSFLNRTFKKEKKNIQIDYVKERKGLYEILVYFPLNMVEQDKELYNIKSLLQNLLLILDQVIERRGDANDILKIQYNNWVLNNSLSHLVFKGVKNKKTKI